MQMFNSSIRFLRNNHFNLNHARRDGGGVHGDNCTVHLGGSSIAVAFETIKQRGEKDCLLNLATSQLGEKTAQQIVTLNTFLNEM